MRVTRQDLIGRKIVDVDMRPFLARRDDETMAHDPIITLDNGVKLSFMVEETDWGEYGIKLTRTAKIKKGSTK